MTINRTDAAIFIYVVYDPNGNIKQSYPDKDEAFNNAETDDRVVTYNKAN